jgi:hypothetical protein
MPDRIPPRVGTSAAVTVSGIPAGGAGVTVSVAGTGGGNGDVTVNGAPSVVLNADATVTLRGVNQTLPGRAGNLSLVAERGGARLAASAGFSVSAIPQNFSIAFDSLITGARRGIRVLNSWESDSGSVGDLSQAERSEQVQYSAGTGSLAGVVGSNSGFRPAHAPPLADSHALAVAGITTPGALTANQVFIFNDRRTGATNIPCTASGFLINRVITADPAGHLLITTAKFGAAATARGFSSGAGSGSVSRTQAV